MEPFLGSITPLAFAFSPAGYSNCNGASLLINGNQALFSLLGTAFGGNGTTTFNIPDLRGRSMKGTGQLNGSSTNYNLGNNGGQENVVLNSSQLPLHTHSLSGVAATTSISVSTGAAGTVTPENGSRLTSTTGGVQAAAAIYLPASTSPTNPVNLGGVATTLTGTIGTTGGNSALDLRNPYLAMNFCIAIQGVYPSRN